MRLVCDAPQIGRNQLPWKHDCIVYDGILYVYIYWSEQNGDVT